MAGERGHIHAADRAAGTQSDGPGLGSRADHRTCAVGTQASSSIRNLSSNRAGSLFGTGSGLGATGVRGTCAGVLVVERLGVGDALVDRHDAGSLVLGLERPGGFLDGGC